MVKLMLENNVRTYMYVLNYTIQGLNLPEWIGMYWATNKLLLFPIIGKTILVRKKNPIRLSNSTLNSTLENIRSIGIFW
jgi:hypothetical protein